MLYFIHTFIEVYLRTKMILIIFWIASIYLAQFKLIGILWTGGWQWNKLYIWNKLYLTWFGRVAVIILPRFVFVVLNQNLAIPKIIISSIQASVNRFYGGRGVCWHCQMHNAGYNDICWNCKQIEKFWQMMTDQIF